VIAFLQRELRLSWERILRKPFPLLVRLFASRFFYGEGDADPEIGMGVGTILSLLSLPGALVSVLLIDKYSTLLHVMRGWRDFDPLAASMPA